MNSIGLANNHMCRDRMYESEAWGKPRFVERLPLLLVTATGHKNLLPRAQCRLAATSLGRQRLGRSAQPRWLQPSVCPRRPTSAMPNVKPATGRAFVTNGPLFASKQTASCPATSSPPTPPAHQGRSQGRPHQPRDSIRSWKSSRTAKWNASRPAGLVENPLPWPMMSREWVVPRPCHRRQQENLPLRVHRPLLFEIGPSKAPHQPKPPLNLPRLDA